jgi:hypothetical protein
LAKKAVARFRMSRSCRRMAFSRRSRFNPSAASSVRPLSGESISRSRRRPIYRGLSGISCVDGRLNITPPWPG